MHETTSPHLPVKVHTDSRVAVAADPLLYGASFETQPPKASPSVDERRRGRLRVGLACAILAVGIVAACAAVFPSVLSGVGSAGNVGQALGQGLLGGGLPPTRDPGVKETETTEVEYSADSEAGLEGESETTSGLLPTDTQEELSETDAEPFPFDTDVPGSSPSSDETGDGGGSAEKSEEPETETSLLIPEGCYPIVSVDMSEQELGVGYITGNAEDIPARLPAGWLWGTDVPPTVLVVNTHPYEGYGDGGDWYDPTEGGLAVTDTPNATEGTVALGAALTRTLRDRGVTVIHLRIAVSAEDTAAEIYDRTETMIRYYCRLYPDIGLVLNLRRSAELTADGGILRTAGNYKGAFCAQARISVSGGRGTMAAERDLAVALALRAGLWALEPSISRPVWVKSGGGLIPELTDVCVLTLEAGAAGNTYDEVTRLVEPMAAVLDELLQDNG